MEYSDYELSGLCAQILLDGNHDQPKHWSTNEDLDNPIQMSCAREYPGNDIID